MLKFIDDAISKLRTKHEINENINIGKGYIAKQRWIDDYAFKWELALGAALAIIKAEKTLTIDVFEDVRNEVRYEGLTFFADYKPKEFEVPGDLAGMKALLMAVSDEIIDMKTLSGSDVRELFRKYSK